MTLRFPALSVLVLPVLLALASPLHAQEGQRRDAQPQATPHRAILPPDAVSDHQITIAGHTLAYSATAGTLYLTDDQGETTAEIFYASFTLANAGDRQNRPVTYVFNGGPGAASAYLDIGAIGPRALDFNADGVLPPKSDKVIDNPDTWLPFTDLVFIDPVGTGWSRALDQDKAPKQFWTVQSDLDSLGDIIRLHLTKSGRLTSPIYIVGESYGGFRAARLAHDLATDHGIAPAGVMMISPVLEFRLQEGGPLDVLPFALRLPSYAAATLGPKSLDPGALTDVEQFALHDYLVALAAGPRQGPAADPIYQKLAQFTGLAEDRIAAWGGRIPVDDYLDDIDRRDGRVASRYDANISGPNPNPLYDDGHDDPVLSATIAPFTSAFVAYARDELGYKTNQPFELLSSDVGKHWDWGGRGARESVGASGALRRALALEPGLKVLIAHGVTDLETPYMTSRYVKDQMPDALGNRVTLKLYAGGHMLYLHPESRHRLHDDAASFYGGGEK